jgi:hypothetical protein
VQPNSAPRFIPLASRGPRRAPATQGLRLRELVVRGLRAICCALDACQGSIERLATSAHQLQAAFIAPQASLAEIPTESAAATPTIASPLPRDCDLECDAPPKKSFGCSPNAAGADSAIPETKDLQPFHELAARESEGEDAACLAARCKQLLSAPRDPRMRFTCVSSTSGGRSSASWKGRAR